MVEKEELRISAEQLKSMYDEYINAGFTKKESLELIKTLMVLSVESQKK